jgi:hypothetical protein
MPLACLPRESHDDGFGMQNCAHLANIGHPVGTDAGLVPAWRRRLWSGSTDCMPHESVPEGSWGS